MAFTLHRLLRQLQISTNRSISSQSYTSKQTSRSDVFKIPASQFIINNKTGELPLVTFTPKSLNLQVNLSINGLTGIPKIIKCPVVTSLEIIEPPKSSRVEQVEDFPTTSMELPALPERAVEKQAARLIGIRKNKMKRHKLRKLRKKMRFEWGKLRQKREMKKEKAFQAELLAQIKEAEKFDATQYVAEKIRKATEVPIPKLWKGKRLPEFLIRQKLGLPPK